MMDGIQWCASMTNNKRYVLLCYVCQYDFPIHLLRLQEESYCLGRTPIQRTVYW
jgi:hypothetical protein